MQLCKTYMLCQTYLSEYVNWFWLKLHCQCVSSDTAIWKLCFCSVVIQYIRMIWRKIVMTEWHVHPLSTINQQDWLVLIFHPSSHSSLLSFFSMVLTPGISVLHMHSHQNKTCKKGEVVIHCPDLQIFLLHCQISVKALVWIKKTFLLNVLWYLLNTFD